MVKRARLRFTPCRHRELDVIKRCESACRAHIIAQRPQNDAVTLEFTFEGDEDENYDSRGACGCTTGCHEWPHARQWHQMTVSSPRSTCSTLT
jgi:hypothetical protein